MKYAYSLLTIKSADEDSREIVGIATTPAPDRAGDVVEPKGAEFKLPIPLLWQHDSAKPIGHVVEAKVTDEGIQIRAKILKIAEEGTLKNRLDEAWQSVKHGLVQGLSIGFKPKEYSRINDSWSYHYLKWLWLELSTVTIPMNGEATITAVKSADDIVLRSMSGTKKEGAVYLTSGGNKVPGVLGRSTNLSTTQSKGTDNMNIAEQIAALQLRRKSTSDRMSEMMTKAAEEGRTFDSSEDEEYDTLAEEIKRIDSHLGRLSTHQKMMVDQSHALPGSTNLPGQGSQPAIQGQVQRGTSVEVGAGGALLVRRNLEKGIPFTRYAMALARAKGNLMQAAELAKKYDGSTPEVGIVLRAAVAAGSTSDTTWAGPLVQYNDMVSEFIEYLRPQTVLGRLTDLRRVPFNTRIPRQTAGTTGSFVGEGSPKPVGKLDFDNVTLPWAKASCIVVLSDELVRLSSPSAEALVRADLAAGISQYLDKRLLDPSFAGVANVSPASLTHAVTARASTGATLGALDDDVAYLYRQYSTNELTLTNGVWVMAPGTAINLSMMRTNQDQKAFPGLSMRGGEFYGLPVITSNNVTAGGSPTDPHMILIDQGEVLLADDGQMMIDMSSEASLQMNDAPSAGAQSLVSLWQNGLLGVKVDRWIYWTKRRSAAVQFIDNANYA